MMEKTLVYLSYILNYRENEYVITAQDLLYFRYPQIDKLMNFKKIPRGSAPELLTFFAQNEVDKDTRLEQ